MSTADWSDGYVTNVDYTMGYYPELNPLRTAFALLMDGYAGPPEGPYCELGFGQGLSIAMHAAADIKRNWWGTDFNPSQTLHARTLTSAAQVDAHLEEQSFAEFCSRDDLPQFAFIGLHGIWSWVSDENRSLIVDFLRRKLMTGGVVYISYNTQPGWAAMVPLRNMLMEHVRWMSAPGTSDVKQMTQALDFAGRVFDLEPNVAKANPLLKQRLDDLRTKAPEYLLHEYMNRDWHPMPFSQVADLLQSAKLSFATSAVLHDRLSDLQVSPEQHAFLQSIDHSGFRESVRDMLVNQQFRRDLWVRGARKLSRAEQMRLVDATHIVLTMNRDEIPATVKGPRGEAKLNKERVDPLLDILSNADRSVRLGTVAAELAERGIPLEATLSMVSMLVGQGAVAPAVTSEQAELSRASTDRLNAYLLTRSTARGDVGYLVSPVTGGALGVPPLTQSFLEGYLSGLKTPEQWCSHVLDRMREAGRNVTQQGVPVTERDKALAVLLPHAQKLHDHVMPILRRTFVVR